MKSCDIGTMFLVKGELDETMGGSNFTVERNVFLQTSTTEDTEDVLQENNWAYAKYENHYYILGEDALKLKNLLTIKSRPEDKDIVIAQVGELRRPMQNGILNTSEEKLSIAIIQNLIKHLLGKPEYPGEHLCFCAPGDPVDSDLSVVFHRTMLTRFLESLGYTVECIPEALAIIFSERPVAEDENEEGGIAPFSGIAFSFGAGMCNVNFAYKQMPLISFSVTRSGDWIDRETAKVTGLNVSAITRFKESKFDLDNVDYSEIKEASLDIFYQNMIEYALKNFADKFNQLDTQIEAPLEIIVAGGTATVPGFINKFQKVLDTLELPFKVKGVRLAKNPLYAVSNGCLIKAMATEKKRKAEKSKEKKESKEKASKTLKYRSREEE